MIGKAFHSSDLDRSEFFVASKLNGDRSSIAAAMSGSVETMAAPLVCVLARSTSPWPLANVRDFVDG